MKTRKKLPAAGKSLDHWLQEEGSEFRAEVMAGAMKRQFVLKLRELMSEAGIGVNSLQKKLKTGPSQVQRLLDPEEIGISLKSIAKLLAALESAGEIIIQSPKRKKKVG